MTPIEIKNIISKGETAKVDFQKAYNKNKKGNGVTININGNINGIGTVTGGSVTQTLNFNK